MINLIRIKDVQEHTDLAVRLLNQNIQYFYNDAVITPEGHRKFIGSIPDDYLWIIEKDGQPCGMVSVYHIDNKNKKCEWGRFVIDSTVRGVGSVVEFMILEFVFKTLGMNKLYCEVFEENTHVVKMHEKFGFSIDGKFREHIWKGNRFLDVVYLSMIFKEWEDKKTRFVDMFADKAGTVET